MSVDLKIEDWMRTSSCSFEKQLTSLFSSSPLKPQSPLYYCEWLYACFGDQMCGCCFKKMSAWHDEIGCYFESVKKSAPAMAGKKKPNFQFKFIPRGVLGSCLHLSPICTESALKRVSHPWNINYSPTNRRSQRHFRSQFSTKYPWLIW